MSITDPIADMFTSLRNASRAGHEKFDIPASGIKKEIALILKREGFIKNIRFIEDRKQGVLRIYLKFDPARKRVAISGVKRISKPGLRIYAKKDNLPRVLGGLGVALLSTSRGIMTDEECRKQGVGGEVLGHIW